MRRPVTFSLIFAAITAPLAGLWMVLRDRSIPLGVPGEWTWARLRADQSGHEAINLALAVLAAVGYAGFVALGMRSLARRSGRAFQAAWAAGLVGASTVVTVAMVNGAPSGYDLARFPIVLSAPNSSGYYSVARDQVQDPWRFWREYPGWIRRQDELHVGTHPPGLILITDAALRLFRSHPGWARTVIDHEPAALIQAHKALEKHYVPLPTPDRAALSIVGGLTLLACAATVAPLYLLARSSLPAPHAWASAACWPLVPSALMFLPTADAAFPLLSATALALASRKSFGGSIGSGVVLGLGMFCTLAFLPVGLIAAILLVGGPGGWRRKAGWLVVTGAGFLAPTLLGWAASGADPFVIWRWNLANHSRFYVTYPRSYAPWVVLGPIETAVGLGLPATVLAALGLTWKDAPRVAAAAFGVLALLDLSGRNLGEVARLWLLLMPPLLPAVGAGLSRVGAGPRTLAALIVLTAVEVWTIQATVQVAYPL